MTTAANAENLSPLQGTSVQGTRAPFQLGLTFAFSVGMPRKPAYHYDLHSIFSQNMHGVKTDTWLGEFLGTCKSRKAFAVCDSGDMHMAQWLRHGTTGIQDGFTFIGVGPPQQQGRAARRRGEHHSLTNVEIRMVGYYNSTSLMGPWASPLCSVCLG